MKEGSKYQPLLEFLRGSNQHEVILSDKATLRLLANKEGLSLQRPEPLRLLKQLATEGVISKAEYQSLKNASPLPNAIAHGFKPTHLTPSTAIELIEVTEQLLNSQNTADPSV